MASGPQKDPAQVRVLVVEDDEQHAAIIARGLRKHAFAVDVAADGEQALFFAQTNAYDVVILDVMLPRLDGLEVCRHLRKAGAHVPILMLTARDGVADRVAGLETGADDYLVKPFEFAELLARVRALLRRQSIYHAPVLAVADLTVDTAAQTATRAGRSLSLTTKEYALLEYLARNSGRVVGRAELAEHVWDNSYDAFSNVIDVYVRRLRLKVDAGDLPPLIHTRRGAGYILGRAQPDEAPSP